GAAKGLRTQSSHPDGGHIRLVHLAWPECGNRIPVGGAAVSPAGHAERHEPADSARRPGRDDAALGRNRRRTPEREAHGQLLAGGGAAMPEAISLMLREKYGIYFNEAYGLTETAAFLHGNPVHRGKPQCLGVPAFGVESRVVDPDTLEELPGGEVGELITSAE